MSAALKPVAPDYLRETHRFEPGDRLHRLVARLGDTYIDDLPDSLIEELERTLDAHRICHASGERFAS